MEVKTFSEIMAEKRRRRQMEKDQKADAGAPGDEAAKRRFRFQPVSFGSFDATGKSVFVLLCFS